jgi:hypothetical protein
MAEIPQYQRQVSPNAPAYSVYIPTPYTAGWDRLSVEAERRSELMQADAMNSLGAAAQAAAGPDNPVSGGVAGALATAFTGSRAFRDGADQVLGAQKTIELQRDNAQLKEQFRNDPAGYDKAIADYTKSTLLKGAPEHFKANLIGVAARTQAQTSAEITANLGAQTRAQNVVNAENSLDTLRTEISDGILNGSLNESQIQDRYVQANALLDGLIKTGDINPLQAKKYRDEVRRNVLFAEARKDFQNDPSQEKVDRWRMALDGKDENALGLRMTPEEREHLSNMLQRDWSRIQHDALVKQTAAAAQITTQINDDIASRATTGKAILSEEQIRYAFPKNPEKAEEVINKQKLADRSYTFQQGIGLSTPAEDADKLAKMKPEPGSTGFADSQLAFTHAQKLIKEKTDAIHKDAALYVLSNAPGVADMVTSPDPAVRQQGYDTMTEFQTRLGVSVGKQTLVPKRTADALVADIHALPPEQAADRIAQIGAQFGPHFPALMRQLASGDNKLAPSYQVLATMTRPEDAQARVDLAKALAFKDSELADNLEKRVPGLKKDLDDRVQRGLTEFTRTAMAQGDPRLVKTLNDATTTLAYYYAGQPGRSPSDAVESAVRATTARYDYLNDMRVPRGMTRQVETATKEAMLGLTTERLEPVPDRPGEVFKPEQKLEQQLAQARAGRWVTNESENGVVLLYPNGQPVYVKTSRGFERLEVPFASAASIDPNAAALPKSEYGSVPSSFYEPAKPAYGKQRAPLRTGNTNE